MPNIFRMGRPTNFKVSTQTEHETHINDKSRDLQGQMPRSQGHRRRTNANKNKNNATK